MTPVNIQFRPQSALAWQVSDNADELDELATWCGGVVVYNLDGTKGPKVVLPIKESRPAPLYADYGDWVTLLAGQFRVVRADEFDSLAERVEVSA